MPPKKVSHDGDDEKKREMIKNRKRLQQIKERAKVRSPSQKNLLKSLEPPPQTPQTASKQRRIDLERDFDHVS